MFSNQTTIRSSVWAIVLLCLCPPLLSRAQDSPSQALTKTTRPVPRTDFNDEIYYKNKLELSMETGVLPFNIPFVFDSLPEVSTRNRLSITRSLPF